MFSSPADRALETARLFAERLGIPAEQVALREELYGGLEPGDFLHIVQRFDNRANTVMVFGHDPSFTEFASYMIPDFSHPIPKAGVLVMDIDRPRWRAVRAGDARAVHFERPPAEDVQKRVDADLMDRLVVAIRSGILAGVRGFGLENSRDATRLVARASTRLARDLRPFARETAPKSAPPGPLKSPAKAGTTKPRRTRRRSA
jgi:hypothetical protein